MGARYLPRIDQQGGGGSPPVEVTDHFAPTIIVGNELSGDPAAAQAAPFEYIADPGDGTGIAAALAAAAGLPGSWVHIRRGTYALAAGALPLTIPDFTRVTGDGPATILAGRADDRRVFVLSGPGTELSHLQIAVDAADPGATGAAVVNALASINGRITNVIISGGIDQDPNESLDAFIEAGGGLWIDSVRLVGQVVNAQAPQLALVRISGAAPNAVVRNSDLNGGDRCVVVETGPAPTGVLIHNNKIQNTLLCVEVGALVLGAALQDNYLVSFGAGVSWGGSGIIMGNTALGGLTMTLTVDSLLTVCVGNRATVTDFGAGNDVAHNIP